MPRQLFRTLPVLVLALALGCKDKPATSPVKDEADVKAAFESVTQALKAKDAAKLWSLLDSDSQKDADRAAKLWQEAYAKAEPDKIKKDIGVSAEELPKLTGQTFLKTEAFFEKEIEELSQTSKVESVKVEGDKATVSYKDPTGGTDKVVFNRQGGQWKVHLSMEKPKKP